VQFRYIVIIYNLAASESQKKNVAPDLERSRNLDQLLVNNARRQLRLFGRCRLSLENNTKMFRKEILYWIHLDEDSVI
jgi:hypothetical protein